MNWSTSLSQTKYMLSELKCYYSQWCNAMIDEKKVTIYEVPVVSSLLDLYKYYFWSLQQLFRVRVISFILQIKILRLREIKELATHLACDWAGIRANEVSLPLEFRCSCSCSHVTSENCKFCQDLCIISTLKTYFTSQILKSCIVIQRLSFL